MRSLLVVLFLATIASAQAPCVLPGPHLLPTRPELQKCRRYTRWLCRKCSREFPDAAICNDALAALCNAGACLQHVPTPAECEAVFGPRP